MSKRHYAIGTVISSWKARSREAGSRAIGNIKSWASYVYAGSTRRTEVEKAEGRRHTELPVTVVPRWKIYIRSFMEFGLSEKARLQSVRYRRSEFSRKHLDSPSIRLSQSPASVWYLFFQLKARSAEEARQNESQSLTSYSHKERFVAQCVRKNTQRGELVWKFNRREKS